MPASSLPTATKDKGVMRAQVTGPSEEGGSFLLYTLRYDFVHFFNNPIVGKSFAITKGDKLHANHNTEKGRNLLFGT
jgi:hypothetical protein